MRVVHCAVLSERVHLHELNFCAHASSHRPMFETIAHRRLFFLALGFTSDFLVHDYDSSAHIGSAHTLSSSHSTLVVHTISST